MEYFVVFFVVAVKFHAFPGAYDKIKFPELYHPHITDVHFTSKVSILSRIQNKNILLDISARQMVLFHVLVIEAYRFSKN